MQFCDQDAITMLSPVLPGLACTCVCLKFFFGDLRVLARKLASPFDRPMQVSTASSTCVRLRLLAGLFGQGFKVKRKSLVVTILHRN